jgi:hypothetical protein
MSNYQRINPVAPISTPPPVAGEPLPIYLQKSHIFISSLPSISTGPEGVMRQFYGNNVPSRRQIQP